MEQPASTHLSAPPTDSDRQPRCPGNWVCRSEVHGVAAQPAHGVDVRQRVGRGNLAKQKRVVDHRRRVDGLHKPQVLPYAEDARIVGGIEPHEQVVVMHIWQVAQDLGEGCRSQLSGSTAQAVINVSLI